MLAKAALPLSGQLSHYGHRLAQPRPSFPADEGVNVTAPGTAVTQQVGPGRSLQQITGSLCVVDSGGQRRKSQTACRIAERNFKDCRGWSADAQVAAPVLLVPAVNHLRLKRVCLPMLAIPPYAPRRTAPRL